MTALQRLPGTQQGGRLRFSPSGRYQGTTKKGVMKCIIYVNKHEALHNATRGIK